MAGWIDEKQVGWIDEKPNSYTVHIWFVHTWIFILDHAD